MTTLTNESHSRSEDTSLKSSTPGKQKKNKFIHFLTEPSCVDQLKQPNNCGLQPPPILTQNKKAPKSDLTTRSCLNMILTNCVDTNICDMIILQLEPYSIKNKNKKRTLVQFKTLQSSQDIRGRLNAAVVSLQTIQLLKTDMKQASEKNTSCICFLDQYEQHWQNRTLGRI